MDVLRIRPMDMRYTFRFQATDPRTSDTTKVDRTVEPERNTAEIVLSD